MVVAIDAMVGGHLAKLIILNRNIDVIRDRNGALEL